MLTAAAQVGFRDVTVTTMKRRDGDRSYTYYVLDLAERIEMRPDALPFPDSPITFDTLSNPDPRMVPMEPWRIGAPHRDVDEFVDQEHSLADEEDRKRADHVAQANTGFGRPRPA
jgi:hypothetical protein